MREFAPSIERVSRIRRWHLECIASSMVLGWLSSIVLVVTLFAQVRKQWHDDTSRGVSPFLFIGQLAASIGFLAYSVQIENWVFTVTNTLTTLAAVIGLWITYRHKKRALGARPSPSMSIHAQMPR